MAAEAHLNGEGKQSAAETCYKAMLAAQILDLDATFGSTRLFRPEHDALLFISRVQRRLAILD